MSEILPREFEMCVQAERGKQKFMQKYYHKCVPPPDAYCFPLEVSLFFPRMFFALGCERRGVRPCGHMRCAMQGCLLPDDCG